MTISVLPVAIGTGDLALLLSTGEASTQDGAFDALLAAETQAAAPASLLPAGDIAPAVPTDPSIAAPIAAAPIIKADNTQPPPPPMPESAAAETPPAMPTLLQAQIAPQQAETANEQDIATPETDAKAASTAQAKPAAHVVRAYKAAENAESEPNNTVDDADPAVTDAGANPAIAVPQPVETVRVAVTSLMDQAGDPLAAIGLDKAAPRLAAKPNAPEAEDDDATDIATDEPAIADAPPMQTATKAKPHSASADAVKPQAVAQEQNEATNAPKAETAEAAPAKPASESKTQDAGPAPTQHHDNQPAPATQSVTATPVSGPAIIVAPVNAGAVNEAPVRLALREAAAGSDSANDLNDLALRIAAKSAAGNSNFQIRLDPPELGGIDVHLKLDSHGNAEAKLTADKPQTLDLLQRDASTLERALKDAGLSLPAGLSFSLKGDGRSNAWRDPQGQGRGRNLQIGAVDAASGVSHLSAAAMAYASGAGHARLDITV